MKVALSAVLALVVASTAAIAQDYPSRTSRSSCRSAPGGPADVFARG